VLQEQQVRLEQTLLLQDQLVQQVRLVPQVVLAQQELTELTVPLVQRVQLDQLVLTAQLLGQLVLLVQLDLQERQVLQVLVHKLRLKAAQPLLIPMLTLLVWVQIQVLLELLRYNQ
jgi:hypothetical protein